MAKRSSLGSMMRKKLTDITNLQTAKAISKDENPPEDCPTDKDYIDQLMRERMTLMRLVSERNKIVELSGAELQKLRISLQKLQQQNLNLAQSNSRMLAELNLGREKVKTLQHELLCKDALLKAKNLEIEVKAEKCQNTESQVSKLKEVDEAALHKADNYGEPCNDNKRRVTRSRSMGPSTACPKVENKEKVENKRRCLRRQSARFRSQTENLFEIEDVKFPVSRTPDNPMHNSGPTPLISCTSKEEKENCAPRRSSVGRPPRKAAVKVHSYKEVPLNVKLRRAE
ncbi:PREDICTED: shugoshin-1 [Prunus dulcis]|uniref:PREDICTED: shugoshin-1 n=1 Tax=Prunus dulcis TaxID=3755 RepID=A0A5E4G367_PRUDU|nr:SHUGOSHIN 2-like isoform X1 [Prunus dulcis]VVA34255.1 PREDICTED: shugoshin-1 [Prunus dulcis]